MPEGLLGEVLSFAPSNAALFALLAVLPAFAALYVHCSVGAKRIPPDLSLRKLETTELVRAVLLYGKVYRRRKELYRTREQAAPNWRARCHARADFRKKFGAELEELESYARDLRHTITRLRGRPLRRYKSWMRVVSSRSALGRSLASYCLMLALLIASSCYADPPLWAPGSSTSFDTFVLWQAFDGRLLLANWMAASFTGMAMPLLYLVRRTGLSREHGRQIRSLREFAAADPDRLIEPRHGDAPASDQADADESEASPESAEPRAWFMVLGVSPSATIEEVKQAYKVLLKQNHPDRVYSMSAAFKELAEVETKKLNVAYEEALAYLRCDDWAQEFGRAAQDTREACAA
jgi:hypothetical protein